MSEALQAYWDSPEFQAYENEYRSFFELYEKACPNGTRSTLPDNERDALELAQSNVANALDVTRRTEAHELAFGWKK